MTEHELCNMCTEYSADVKCENRDACKLLNIIKENQALKKENKDLKRANEELRLNMSYMINPNTIGYRNDMGW